LTDATVSHKRTVRLHRVFASSPQRGARVPEGPAWCATPGLVGELGRIAAEPTCRTEYRRLRRASYPGTFLNPDVRQS
jgi:hypothetical protein